MSMGGENSLLLQRFKEVEKKRIINEESRYILSVLACDTATECEGFRELL